jgi:hypothetical protein
MSTSIMIHREFDNAAIAAECPYNIEITEVEARAFAAVIAASTKGVFISNEEGYDVFVESFGLSRVASQIDELKAIFTNPLVHTLFDQVIRHDICIYLTEAPHLGVGRYLLIREVNAADDVSMHMSGGSFPYLWERLGFTPTSDAGTVGTLALDEVEAALDKQEPTFTVAEMQRYAANLRTLIAYGRKCGASELHWA